MTYLINRGILGKQDCFVMGCGAAKFLKVFDPDFKFDPWELIAPHVAVLYEKKI